MAGLSSVKHTTLAKGIMDERDALYRARSDHCGRFVVHVLVVASTPLTPLMSPIDTTHATTPKSTYLLDVPEAHPRPPRYTNARCSP